MRFNLILCGGKNNSGFPGKRVQNLQIRNREVHRRLIYVVLSGIFINGQKIGMYIKIIKVIFRLRIIDHYFYTKPKKKDEPEND